jgi:hypothetical protein
MQEVFREKRIAELEEMIKELKSRLPAHSVPASLMIDLEELEEERISMESGAIEE